MKKDLIIFGASNMGKIAYNKLKNKYNIIYFCDNSKEKWNQFICKTPIISPQDLKKYRDKDIVIASSYVKEIEKQLKQSGYTKVKIFTLIDVFGERRYFLKKDSSIKAKSNKIKIVKRIVFIIDGNNLFCTKIVERLKEKYEVRVVNTKDEKKIFEAIKWCDLCWFEWCDSLISYYTNLNILESKKVICRLHSYEVFNDLIYKVNWNNVDKVIFVAEWVKNNFIDKIEIEKTKVVVISNIFDFDNWNFKERKKGYNIAVIGNIGWKKNFPMIIQFFYELWRLDNNYKMYIAYYSEGEIEKRYLDNIVKKLRIEQNVIFSGNIDHNKLAYWLADKEYIVSGSIIESQGMNILEGMASGIKPVIGYFPYSEQLYPEKYIYYSNQDFINQITSNEYNSFEYRNLVEKNFDEEKIILSINAVIDNI